MDDEDLLNTDPRSLKQAQEALIHMSERNKRLRGERKAADKEAADLRAKLDATNDLWMNAVNAEREARQKKEDASRDLSNVNEMLQQETIRADREAEAAAAAKASASSATARREAAEARAEEASAVAAAAEAAVEAEKVRLRAERATAGGGTRLFAPHAGIKKIRTNYYS